MAMVGVDDSSLQKTHRLGLRVGCHLALRLHSWHKPSELLQYIWHDDSTINIVNFIINIIINLTTSHTVNNDPN